jgi:RNA polymerase sigma-70 factor (ECF subfamily)
VERTTSSERAELHVLYRDYEGRVRRLCRRLLRDSSAAEDATHETFLRVRPYLSSAEQGQRLALLYRIAKNHCCNVLRESKIRARHLAIGLALDPEESADTPARRVSAKQELGQLSQQTQRIVILAYAAGMTQGEIARHLGISRRTVVYRLSELRSAG